MANENINMPASLGELRAKFICVTGIDGAGKTTHAKMLVEALKEQGIRARYVYLRAPHFFSKPLMGLCRLNGITEKIRDRAGTPLRSFHHFYKSRWLTFIVPWLQALDMHFYTFKDVTLPRLLGYAVVCDRHTVDTMIDMMVETHRLEMPDEPVGTYFLKAMPRDSLLVVLVGDKDAILARKDDLEYDEYYAEKYELFMTVQKRLEDRTAITVDSTAMGPDQVLEKVLNALSRTKGPEPRKWTKALRHMLIQGMAYADTSERIYKIVSFMILAAVFGLPVKILMPHSLVLPIMGGAVLGHLANFVLNGFFWSTVICDLKLAAPPGKKKLYDYLKGLEGRAAGCGSIGAYAAFGSIARKGLHDSSDLDMVLVRKPGLSNALSTFRFVLAEHLYALRHGIPLELWVADSPAFLKRLRVDERPVTISDCQGWLAEHFVEIQTVEEAILANGDQDLFEPAAEGGNP